MKPYFSPNGSWPKELDDIADRIERVQRGYAQWKQHQVKVESRAKTPSSKIGRLKGAISRILRLLMGN